MDSLGGLILKITRLGLLILIVLVGGLAFTNSINKSLASSGLEINIFLPEAVNNPSALGQFGNQLGVQFSSAKWYLDWSDDFTPEIARGFKGEGAIPELTWQPQIGGNGIAFSDVISGKYDSYINDFIRNVVSLGFTIRISLAPEMNSDWEPWSVGNNGNTANNFKDFWRYTVQKFRDQGANNVEWIWSPNVHYWGEPVSFADVFPGDDYLDFAGLDGYNWGTSQSWSEWQSFSEVFSSSYYTLTDLTSKNILITEVASTEIGGNKDQWIVDMFSDLRGKFSRIQGFTWFNIDKETDWRINSSQASMEAFIRAVQGDLSPASTDQNNDNLNEAEAIETSEENMTADTQNSPQMVAQISEKENIQNSPTIVETPIVKVISSPLKKIAGVSENSYFIKVKQGFKWLNFINLALENFLASKQSKIILKISLEYLFILLICTLLVESPKSLKTALKQQPEPAFNYSVDIASIPFLNQKLSIN